MITVVWDTWFKPDTEEEGLRLSRQMWSEMRSFDGYVSHRILVDEDAPGHIIALAEWCSRADADAVREKYWDSGTMRELTPLLARPRDRWMTREDLSPNVQPRSAAKPGLFQRIRCWWQSGNCDEQYLAEAANLADLERRQRVLEHTNGGPPFVTFNH